YITATYKEVDELIESKCEMIAMDATSLARPDGITVKQLVDYAKEKAPHVELMADIATVADAKQAEKLGFDCISTTLHGYTEATTAHKLYDNDFAFLKEVLNAVSIPVIAEGNVQTPEMLKRCMEIGAYSAVVGGSDRKSTRLNSSHVSIS